MHPRRRCSRRVRLGVLALVVALLCLGTACTSTSDPDDSPSVTESSSAAPTSPSASSTTDPATLRLAVYGDPAEVRAYRALASAFAKSEPGMSVQVESSPDASRAQARLDAQFDAGSAPDVFLSDATALPRLESEGRVQPVDGLLEERGIDFGDSYERLGLEAMAANASLQCMPNDVSPYVVFYNRSLLDTIGLTRLGGRVPTPENGWRWPLFIEAAEQMSTHGVKGVYLAPRLTQLTPLMRSAGTDIVDDPKRPTTLTLDDGSSRNALARILEVARDPHLTPTLAQLRQEGPLDRFENGKLGMMIGTRALVPELRRHRGLRFDVYPLPILGRFRTVADVRGYCINRASQHREAAADFLAFASGTRGAKITARSGGIVPANLDALHSKAFLQPAKLPINGTVFSAVIRRADTVPNPPAWPEVVRQTQPLLDELYYSAVPDLDRILPRIDQISAQLLAEPTPSPSPSPSG